MTSLQIPLLFGPYGSTALTHVTQLPAYGVNAIWFHGFDVQAFEQCSRHNLAACVEFKTFRANFTQHPELIPIGVDGKPIRYGELVQGVCLSKEDFLAETEEALLLGLHNFQPTGIWLDYLTYAGWFETPSPDLQESCFCADCVAEFCCANNLDAARPEYILSHHAALWERHKCERIAGFTAHYARLIKTHRPDCIVGAYMCPWTPAEFDRALTRIFAQDYTLLAPAIDIFTPLIYAKKSGREPGWGRMYMEDASAFIPAERKVQLILDALDFPESLEAVAESSLPGWGIQLFGGANVFNDPEKGRIFEKCVQKMKHTLCGKELEAIDSSLQSLDVILSGEALAAAQKPLLEKRAALLPGGGAIAQGAGSVVVGAGGTHVGGSVGGDVVTRTRVTQTAGNDAIQIGKARDVNIKRP